MTKTYTDISNDNKKLYRITTPGEHVFFLHNRSDEIVFSLEKEGAHVKIYGLYEGKEDEKFALHTTQHHKAPHTSSQTLIKGIFSDRSHFSYDGLIRIEKKAQHTQAHLTNRNIVLSKKVVIHTQPILEILPQDVICTHAATIGAPSEEQINFLISRGMNKKTATRLIVDGFRNDLKKLLPTAREIQL